MSAKIKAPTNREKIDTYESVFNALHFHTTVTNNRAEVDRIMKNIFAWCESNSRPAGSAKEFWDLV